MKDLKFIEKREKRSAIVGMKVLPFLSEEQSRNIKGGLVNFTATSKQVASCDPWSSCDAWNCAPDCVCKSNLC